MKRTNLLHVLQAAVLILLTAVIPITVTRFGKTQPVSEPSTLLPQTTTAVQQTETLPQTTETLWVPEIEYDSYTPSEIVHENFRDTVILGNSQAQALSQYGLIRNADFVTRIGLSIIHVLTAKSGEAPITELYGKTYRKAVFVFGENELGWPYPDNFITHYKEVIAKVRELNPGVEVYCQAIFPVTAKLSAESKAGVTNENVRIFNAKIRQMCEQIDAHFMPVTDVFFDSSGALPADAATDGVHFGYDYCKIWAGDLSAYLQPDPTESTAWPAAAQPQEIPESPQEGVVDQ